MRLLISIIESIYIVYMFNYFKTDVYFNHPFDLFTKKMKLMDHSNKENHVCIIGNITGYILALWFIGRNFMSNTIDQKYNQMIINIVFLGSLISNTNAFVYFLPIYLIENKDILTKL